MTQISIASAKSKTVGGQSITITAASNAAPIAVTATAHGLETGDIVQVSGVTGNLAANGQFVITKTSANAFTLNNSNGSGAYVSGGAAAHVGFATAAALVDNTIFSAVPSNLTFVFRLELAPAGAKMRFVLEDSADSAFVTAMPGPAGSFPGQVGLSYDKKWSARYQDFPDLRLAASGDNMRVKVMFGSPTAAQVFQFSSWLEY